MASPTFDAVLDGLDFEPSCGMWRCKDAPNVATHTMEISPPLCPCHATYLVCAPCVEHFWTVKARERTTCEIHPAFMYVWAQIVHICPLRRV